MSEWSPEVPSGTSTVRDVRLAVLDSDSGFLTVLAKRFDALGWEHRVIASPVSTHELSAIRLNAIVVDPAVLGPAAWGYLERLCAALPSVGVLVCTGPSSVAQRVRGLRLGADDWITKPCHPDEVVARVEAVTRRRRRTEMANAEDVPIIAGELEIRRGRFQAYVEGRSLDLTRREFELIELLASVGGRAVEREQIYERVWGYTMARGDRSVDVFVRKLRQKLELASPAWQYIHTHVGVGYRFDPEPVPGSLSTAEPTGLGPWAGPVGPARECERPATPAPGGGRRARAEPAASSAAHQ